MMTEAPVPFGTLLRRHRLAAGLSQEALAERAGLSARAVRALEGGQRRAPHPHTVRQLARALRLAPADRARLEAAVARRLAPAPPDPAATNLPLTLTSFIGRAAELAEVRRLLGTTRLLTLTGAGGVGKTRLALAAAQTVRADYPDGVWLVELAALTDPALVTPAVAAALGVREQPDRPLLTTLTAALAARRLLLALDNCEHLLAACAPLVDALLRAGPGLRVLATSREALGVPGEVAWRVPSLALPEPLAAAGGADTAALPRAEAVRLFVERARAARPDFALTHGNAAAVAEVCRRLDGIPLAIELAAARVSLLTVEQIAARLDDRFRLLTGGGRTAPSRQQTLRATSDWSHDLLTEPERALFRRLAVFAGGWTLEVAETVCSMQQAVGSGSSALPSQLPTAYRLLPAGDVLDLLGRLVDKSLVLVDQQGGEVRYRLHETMRQYAAERLQEAGELATARRRHAAWSLALAERAEPELEGADQLAWFARLDAEHDNLRAALAWSLEENPQAGLRLAGGLWPFWRVRAHFTEGERWLDSLLARAPEPTAPRAKALLGAALLSEQARTGATRARLEEALPLCRALGDRRLLALALRELGFLLSEYGPNARGQALLEEGLALARADGDERGLGASLFMLAGAAARDGDHARARALGEASLPVLRRVGDRWMLSRALSFLGIVALRAGDCARARAFWEEALPLAQEAGAPNLMAMLRVRLGWAALWQGDTVRAEVEYEAARTLAQRHAVGARLADALAGLGRVAQVRGDGGRATALLTEGLALHAERGAVDGVGEAQYGLGLAARDQGDAARAADWLRRSLAVRWETDDRPGIATCLEGLATVAAGGGRPARAARLLGAAEALRRAIGSPMPLVELPACEAAVRAARAALGEAAVAAAWAEGRALTLEEAVAEALAGEPTGADGPA
jgi:predicted ATPase/DNA-binding XRE family transcriptional regulator